MSDHDLIRVHRIERTMADFPRVKIERFPMSESNRFRLKVKMRNITLDNDGSLLFWIDRGDINNLHLDCSNVLLDDDIETGRVDVESMVGS